MKILSAGQTREADAYTIENEPIASIDLMERASMQFSHWLMDRLKDNDRVSFFCGPGNNGGDGLAVARILHKNGFEVNVWLIEIGKRSADFEINLKRLQQMNTPVESIESDTDLDKLDVGNIAVDAIFGSGLTRIVEGLAAKTIDFINKKKLTRISIDIPSGIFADKSSLLDENTVFRAHHTLSFQMPKLAFFMPENEAFVGDWDIAPIGLDEDFIQSCNSPYQLIDKQLISSLLKQRSKFSHKGTFGHALLVSGSKGKAGAAALSSHACLRSGAGLFTCHLPSSIAQNFHASLAEAMVSFDEGTEHLCGPVKPQNFTAIAAGPGIGTHSQTENMLKLLIQETNSPMVLDADALNILAENPTWLAFLPKGSILTPHPGEFKRLFGSYKSHFEAIEMQSEKSMKFGIHILLKGAHSSISTPDGQVFFNTSGNPGMATAGSGDVLTGMILGLLSQSYTPLTASLAGAFLHGLAGDLALENQSMESMIAGDIIHNIGEAFKRTQA